MTLAFTRFVVRIAGLMVPAGQRKRFHREWDAELWHEAHARTDTANRASSYHNPLRCMPGIWADARTLSRIERESRKGGASHEWWSGWRSDMRFAFRSLARSPGFTSVAVVTLGLGMGGSSAIYTLLDRVVLDPLPYPEPDRLVELANRVPGVGPEVVWGASTAQQIFIGERARSFESTGLYRGRGQNIDTPEGPQRAFGWAVTAEVLPLLGARTVAGRLLTPQDDRPGVPPVVVLSHGFWQRQFGADPDIVGRTIQISEEPYEVVGVLEDGVRIPGRRGAAADLWIPMQIDPGGYFGNNHVFSMIGRLAVGTDHASAEAELGRLRSELPERFPDAYNPGFLNGSGFYTQVVSLKEAVIGDTARNLWILFGGVGLVLFIAVANVANLFLVRMEARRRELDIRAALGASGAALARYLLSEGLGLALLGGGLALLLGYWSVPMLISLAPEALPRVQELPGMAFDTMAFTAVLAFAVGGGLAVLPLLRGSRTVGAGNLAGGGRSTTTGRPRQRLRSLLVVTQVALALTLIVGASLLVESLRRLNQVDTGIQPDGVLTAGLYLTPARYEDDTAMWAAYSQILDRIRAIPGVTEAGMSEELPIQGGFGCTVQGFEEAAVFARLADVDLSTCAGQEITTPGYFEALGIPLLRGRTFTRVDNDAPRRGAAVVSQAFADRFWPGEEALGKGVAPNGRTVEPYYRVVGVVGDVPARSVHGDPAIAIYYPVVHNPDTPGNWDGWRPVSLQLVVRTRLPDPLALVPDVRAAVEAVDGSIPVTNPASMERVAAASVARFTFTSVLLAVAAAVALVLAAVGLYGVVSYVVGRRTREIGMRIALGARSVEVEHLFLRRSAVLVAVGLLVGVALALGTTRLLEGMLFGVQPTEPAAFLAAGGLLTIVALLATWIPARRASRIDPIEALRFD